MNTLIDQIKKELNRHLAKETAFNIEIQNSCKDYVWFFVDGNLDITNVVQLTNTGKVKKNSHRTEWNYIK